MASKMDIELALANLEAGKFSFRMVDAIKEQLEKLESEVTLMREQHIELTNELRLQQIANWRLEGETTRLNDKIHSLVRANVLAEKASHTAASAANSCGRIASPLPGAGDARGDETSGKGHRRDGRPRGQAGQIRAQAPQAGFARLRSRGEPRASEAADFGLGQERRLAASSPRGIV